MLTSRQTSIDDVACGDREHFISMASFALIGNSTAGCVWKGSRWFCGGVEGCLQDIAFQIPFATSMPWPGAYKLALAGSGKHQSADMCPMKQLPPPQSRTCVVYAARNMQARPCQLHELIMVIDMHNDQCNMIMILHNYIMMIHDSFIN